MDEIDFKELLKDENFTNRIKSFDAAIDKIDEVVQSMTPDLYEKLSDTEKINYNLLLSFTLNGLYAMYLKVEGMCPQIT